MNNVLFVLPLLMGFHIGAAYFGSNLAAPRLIGQILSYFGATADFLPPLLIVTVLVLQQLARRDPWEIHPTALAGMVAESIAWTIPLIAIHQLTGRLISAPAVLSTSAAAADEAGIPRIIIGALGAGIYEELTFRLILISLAMLIFVDIFQLKKPYVVAGAVIGGAIIFALCHFSGDELVHPAHLEWPKLLFLTVAGVLWGCLYVYRGFGIAVGAHVVWDLYVGFCRT